MTFFTTWTNYDWLKLLNCLFMHLGGYSSQWWKNFPKTYGDVLCFSYLSFPIEEKGVFFHHGFYSWDGFPKIENHEDGVLYTFGIIW